MRILYLTTFNEVLYRKTGENLVKSFLRNISVGDLLVCHEDMSFQNDSCRVKTFNMNESAFLRTWLQDNAHNIPELYGGTARNDDVRFVLDRQKGQSWARFRASRYFRKVAALNFFLERYSGDYDFLILVDSDCVFQKDLPEILLGNLFEDTDMFFFWSQHRKNINRGPETGFTGYSRNGYSFIRNLCQCYSTGAFLQYEYWDDGFIIGKLIEKGGFKFKDLVEDTHHRTTRVMEIPNNPLHGIVHHFKNSHATPEELVWLD